MVILWQFSLMLHLSCHLMWFLGCYFLMGYPLPTSSWPHWSTKDQWLWRCGICGEYRPRRRSLRWRSHWMESTVRSCSPQPALHRVAPRLWSSQKRRPGYDHVAWSCARCAENIPTTQESFVSTCQSGYPPGIHVVLINWRAQIWQIVGENK